MTDEPLKLALQAIKELKEEIQNLKDELYTLGSEIRWLETRNVDY